jgi:hypothetical protein
MACRRLWLFVLLATVSASGLEVAPPIELAARLIEPSPFPRENAKVATNGTDFLTVWWDRRGEIRGARLDANGELIDARSFAIGQGGPDVSVASDGQNYAVAYRCESAICVRRVVAGTGGVLGGATIEGTSIAGVAAPAIAFTTEGYVVAYRNEAPRAVHAVALHADATIAGAPFYIASSQSAPAIASNGRQCLVIWSTENELKGAIVAGGAVTSRVTVTQYEAHPGPGGLSWAVASDGDRFGVVWQENTGRISNGYQSELRMRTVASDGSLASPRRQLYSADAFRLALTWTGGGYTILFTDDVGNPGLDVGDDADVRTKAVEREGDVVRSGVTIASRDGREVSGGIAWNGRVVVAVWENRHRNGAHQIEGQVLGHETFVISRSVIWQESVSAARVGEETRVVWSERVGEEQRRRVMLQRVGAEGPLERDARVVSGSPRDQLHPAIAGSLVVWLEQTAEEAVVWAGAEGRPPIRVGGAQRDSKIAVAAIGNVHLVAWVSPDEEITTTRVSPKSVLDPVPLTIGRGVDPAVATDGSRFLVAWNRLDRNVSCVPGCRYPRSLHAALVSRTGFLVTPEVEVAPANTDAAKVVWNGESYVVFALGTEPVSDHGERIFARKVTRNGNLDGPAATVTEDAHHLHGVVWTGKDYLLAYAGPELVAARVDSRFGLTGTVIPRQEFHEPAAALTPDWLFTEVLGDLMSRIVGRRIGDDVMPPRRRAVTAR